MTTANDNRTISEMIEQASEIEPDEDAVDALIRADLAAAEAAGDEETARALREALAER